MRSFGASRMLGPPPNMRLKLSAPVRECRIAFVSLQRGAAVQGAFR